MLFEKRAFYLLVCVFGMTLIGCQPKVYLMPSPVGIKAGGELFNLMANNKDENFLHTFYATNRQPIEGVNESDHYSIFPSKTLKLGYVVHRVGDEGMSWEEIYEQSLKVDRDKDLLLTREYVRKVASFHVEDDLTVISSEAEGFFDNINQVIDESFADKDILIYVHGANSNFYRATAQGAQFYHFTGHNSVLISFSWPSAESLLKYKIDVLHAKKTIPAFARLVELLANHTKAKHINILAYSAGAQVVAPGLAYFHDTYPDETKAELKERLRIGEVYFAAPDTALEPFVERYEKFKDLVERTTINININDSVLSLSQFQNEASRLGRPDASELSDEELKVLIEASTRPQLNLLDVGGSEYLDLGGAHDSWYNHPWVSTDALMLLLFNAHPLERGLEEYWQKDGTKTFRFPSDYGTRIRTIIAENREMLLEKLKVERGE